MPDKNISLRDKIGEQLRSNKVASFIAILLVVFLIGIDGFAPPLGIPVAVLFIWFLLRVSRTGWQDIGFKRPKSWLKTIGIGIGVVLLLQALGIIVLFPMMQYFGIQLPDYSRFEEIRGNLPMLFVWLGVSWTTAGFGEEIIWRGFVMTRLAKILGGGKTAWVSSLILISIVFGLLHIYQGWFGVIMTGTVGLILGILYIATGRNLWSSIIAHGMTDTTSFLIIYSGVYQHLI